MKLYTSTVDVEQPEGFEAGYLDMQDVLAVLRRQGRMILLVILSCLCFGGLFLVVTQPFYTATLTLLLDLDGDLKSETRNEAERGWAKININYNDPYIDTQVRLFQSYAILDKVIDRLDLLDNGEFVASADALDNSLFNLRFSLLARVGLLEGRKVRAEVQDKRSWARDALLNGLFIQRVGDSTILRVSFTAATPTLSARIVNAFGNAYGEDILNARYEATQLASQWLQERLVELRKKAIDSDMAVQTYRSQNKLLETYDKDIKDSQPLIDQELRALNEALTSARAEEASARARYDQIKGMIDGGAWQSQVAGSLANFISNDLRLRYLEASRREADIARRLGADHIQAQDLRRQMDIYRGQMFDELKRVASSYLSEATISAQRVVSLEQGLQNAMASHSVSAQREVQLRELENKAQNYRDLYEAALTNYRTALSLQGLPVSRSRIITPGSPPDSPNYPNRAMFMGMCLMIGVLTSLVIGSYREYRDRTFRTEEQVESWLSLPFLGMTPRITEGSGEARRDAGIEVLARQAIEAPLSLFAETLRSAKVTIDIELPKQSRVVGIVSTLSAEGRSTIAMNFARLLADQGHRVVLVDADLRRPRAGGVLAHRAKAGLVDVLIGRASLAQALAEDSGTPLKVIASGAAQRVPHSASLLESRQMQAFLSELRQSFDYIIIDLPALRTAVDARAISPFVDRFIYVVEWSRTSRRLALQTLDVEQEIAAACVGVMMNKVDASRAPFYLRPDFLTKHAATAGAPA
ncbi:hypothetical protein BTR14_22145 [Rhizobium rhizosphaerae]|uniref:non-specific protein-tyrosine kinase n=1 Tax=Xaviernesmea rhizosphaerae TaxID=1672749 RepID=A0ABX3P8J3_9HYPH|nr:polysaccharide biosynthesis tyrosine autokinase [Xaviernesmea rhizosphaerae]OQP83613.1 hypothetical protein BTR14_22145 [Xaviernesmea rhizosphaerae]